MKKLNFKIFIILLVYTLISFSYSVIEEVDLKYYEIGFNESKSDLELKFECSTSSKIYIYNMTTDPQFFNQLYAAIKKIHRNKNVWYSLDRSPNATLWRNKYPKIALELNENKIVGFTISIYYSIEKTIPNNDSNPNYKTEGTDQRHIFKGIKLVDDGAKGQKIELDYNNQVYSLNNSKNQNLFEIIFNELCDMQATYDSLMALKNLSPMDQDDRKFYFDNFNTCDDYTFRLIYDSNEKILGIRRFYNEMMPNLWNHQN